MISVCIACHNGQQYILQQIQSILPQLDCNDEVLISDDDSSDNTVKILNSINDNRIKIYHNIFYNPVKNFEFLIGKSKGDIIFLSDQDDIWDSKKVKNHLKKHSIDSLPKLVISNISLIDINGKSIDKKFFKKNFTSSPFLNIIKNNFIGCSISFNKEIKKTILPFPQKIPMHDWWIGLICGLHYNVIFINEMLVYYRIHENNFTKKNKYNMLQKIYFRILLLFYLMKRSFKKQIS